MAVYFSPTQANRLMVATMSTLPFLRTACFVELPQERIIRIRQLEGLPHGSVFIWGDGHRHDESYHFTKRKDIDWKINIDNHTDTWARFEPKDGIDFANHMTASERDGIQIATKIDSTEKIERLRYRMQDAQRVALSVDCDGIHRFPAEYKWISENTARPGEVVALIQALGARLRMLDIGGLVETIPEFSMLPYDPMRIPSIEGVRKLALGNPSNEAASYACATYAQIIATYLQTVGDSGFTQSSSL